VRWPRCRWPSRSDAELTKKTAAAFVPSALLFLAQPQDALASNGGIRIEDTNDHARNPALFNDAIRLLGETLTTIGRPREGELATSRANQLPAYAPYADLAELNARNNLATALARQGKLAAATAELRQVLAMDPENGIARANLEMIRGAGRRQ
jgi:hypothetical protein